MHKEPCIVSSDRLFRVSKEGVNPGAVFFWRARRGRVSSRSFHQPNVLEDEHAFAFDAPESAIGRPPTRSICGRRP